MGTDEPGEEGLGHEESAPEESDEPRRIPPDDPADDDQKRFMIRREEGALIVSVAGADVGQIEGPARLLGDLASSIADVVKAFNGGEAQLRGLVPGNSMVYIFSDRAPGTEQEQLPVGSTLAAAEVVSDLLTLGGEEIFERALDLTSRQVRAYRDFTHLVHVANVELTWEPRTRDPKKLEPRHAGIQFSSLDREPELKGREMRVNGTLYRAIEAVPGKAGTIGIHLFKWSLAPSGSKAPGVLYVEFDGPGLHDDIKRLFGEPVEAVIDIQQPVPGQSVDPEKKKIVLRSIASGPSEDSVHGTRIDQDNVENHQ